MKKQKVLFFGAGVLGSLYAARLHEAGADVTILARGKRFDDLNEHGIVLEHFETGERTQTTVKVVNKMPENEYFDFCVVTVQKTQLESTLPVLAANTHIPTFVFMTNMAEGPQAIIEALGNERVLLSHGNAGGEREGHIVRYMIAEKMPLGELDGSRSERLQEIAGTFRDAGFPVDYVSNMDAWKRYHVALAVPFAYAMYRNNSCNYSLAENREDVRLCLRGMKEAFRALQGLDFPMEPPRLRGIFAIPEFILVPLFQRLLKTNLADIGMARHLRNAKEEMDLLTEEFFVLVKKSKLETPVLEKLHCQYRQDQSGLPEAVTA